MHEDLLKTIKQGTTYIGSNEPEQKSLSASSFGLEPQQLVLRYKHGNMEPEWSFNESVFGSVTHLGFESIFKDNTRYECEAKRNMTINGWTVTGSVDLLDKENQSIYDWKILGSRGFHKSLRKESYIENMSIYNMLFPEYNNLFLFAINKGGKSTNKDFYDIINVTDSIWSYSDTNNRIVDLTTNIEKWMLEPKTIPECNVWQFGRTPQGRPGKCELYCSWRDVCPVYTKRLGGTNHSILKDLLL